MSSQRTQEISIAPEPSAKLQYGSHKRNDTSSKKVILTHGPLGLLSNESVNCSKRKVTSKSPLRVLRHKAELSEIGSTTLGGHFKTGHRWAGQNRPMGGHPGLSCFILPAPLLASRF